MQDDRSLYRARLWRRVTVALATFLAVMLGPPASAQYPDFPYAYIYGLRVDSDVAGPTKALRGDGFPDASIKLYLNNIAFYTGHPYNNSVTLRSLRLYNKSIPGLVWDTVPNSSAPPLIVKWEGKILNRHDGGIDGVTLPNFILLELFVADSGPVRNHRAGFVLEIKTMDSLYKLDVKPFDPVDRSFF